MTTIDDLNTSISEMSQEEATKLLMGIRSNRRTRKVVRKTTKKKTAPKKKKQFSLKDLSADQRAKLIAVLEDMI